MLVTSALLNLKVQQFFASCRPLVLFSACLCPTLLLSLTRSVIMFSLSQLMRLSTSKFQMFSRRLSQLGFLPSYAPNAELETLSCSSRSLLSPRFASLLSVLQTSDFLKHVSFFCIFFVKISNGLWFPVFPQCSYYQFPPAV